MLSGDASVKMDAATSTLHVSKLSVSEFSGDVDFKGGSVKNAALVNPTLEGTGHLNVESLGVLGQAAQTAGKVGRVALFNDAGMVAAEADLRWEEDKGLKVGTGVGGLGSGDLAVTSSVDFQKNVLKNVVLEKNTLIKDVTLTGVSVENARLVNVTATDLTLGDIKVEGIAVSELDQSVGALVGVGVGGKLRGYM